MLLLEMRSSCLSRIEESFDQAAKKVKGLDLVVHSRFNNSWNNRVDRDVIAQNITHWWDDSKHEGKEADVTNVRNQS